MHIRHDSRLFLVCVLLNPHARVKIYEQIVVHRKDTSQKE